MQLISSAKALPLAAVLLLVVFAVPSAEATVPPAPIVGFNDDFNAFELVEPEEGPKSPLPVIPGGLAVGDLVSPRPEEAPPAMTPKRAALIKRASEGGGRVIRYAVPWLRVERVEGAYDWATEDATYELALEAGLEPLIILVTAPCWAHPSIPCDPLGRQVARPDAAYLDEFGDFARAAAERYPEAVGFEIWNESNHPAYWGTEPSASEYQGLLEAAWNSTREVEPRPTIAYNGLTPSKGWKQYLHASYGELGAGAFADVTALHPYVGKRGPKRVRGQLRFARRTLRTAVAPKRIWFTEFGWSTHPEAPSRVGERAQAKRTLRILDLARKARVEVAVIHRLKDIEHPSSAWESGLGALRLDGSPKPLFCGLAQLSSEAQPSGC